MIYGVSSMTDPLKKVAVMKPSFSLKNADPSKWNYGPKFKPEKIDRIHSSFVSLLEDAGVEIYWMNEDDQGIADAIFTYDASLMTKNGAILMSPGKPLRSGEQDIHRKFYEKHNIPIIGSIQGPAFAEAGDTLWLDDKTLIIGRGFRTTQRGINQLKDIVSPLGIEVHVFDLPVYLGAQACLHLMSLISLVDDKKALVYMPFLPVGLYKLLLKKDFTLIQAPVEEYESSNTLSANVLATSPGNCIMIDGLADTQASLSDAGINVKVFKGEELCVGCEGGPTCLTRPLLRQ
jgi:N-dimethylarginine dimethylaminohydrolase